MKNIDLRKANIPQSYWSRDKENVVIPHREQLEKYFKDYEQNFHHKNLYIHASDLSWCEYVLSLTAISFLKRGIGAFCVSAITIGDEVKSKACFDEYENRYDVLTNIPALLVFSLGHESTRDFKRNQDVLSTILEKRFFQGKVTVFGSDASASDLRGLEKYDEHFLKRLIDHSLHIDVSNQLDSV